MEARCLHMVYICRGTPLEALSCSLVAPFSTPLVLTQALPISTDTASLPALALECISKPRSRLLKLLSPLIWWLVPQDSSPVPLAIVVPTTWAERRLGEQGKVIGKWNVAFSRGPRVYWNEHCLLRI